MRSDPADQDAGGVRSPGQPLLTIAVPTWNRDHYLERLLQVLGGELRGLPPGDVEVLICDNCSDDSTPNVVEAARQAGLPIRGVRHGENIGSDRNIAFCHNESRGQYAWILGDDDLPLPGAIANLLGVLRDQHPAVVYLRPFGFENDYLAECPPTGSQCLTFAEPALFFGKVGAQITLISAIVYDHEAVCDVDAMQFCGTNLVQVNLYLLAARARPLFVYFTGYCLAYQKVNARTIEIARVFVTNLHGILLAHEGPQQSSALREAVERQMLVQFYPQSVLLARRAGQLDMRDERTRFRACFGHLPLYRWMIDPIFTLPKPFWLWWGFLATIGGRIIAGDLFHGLRFLRNRMRASLHGS